MVSQKTIEIVKSTAPIVKEKGEEITRRMYQILFAERPDYKRSFETTWMQALDGREQAQKLATSVYAYATHIDRLDELAKAVDTIAHRHVETRILPEQYPLIGEKLLQAMKDVLQDDATDEVISAWAEAYEALATILIQKESGLYMKCRLSWQLANITAVLFQIDPYYPKGLRWCEIKPRRSLSLTQFE